MKAHAPAGEPHAPSEAEGARPPAALVVAGLDPSGGAGLLADLKVLHQHRVYGAAVATTLTVQNSIGVRASYPVADAIVAEQLGCLIEDMDFQALKVGALGSAGIVSVVSAHIARLSCPIVIDPVLRSTGGRSLLTEEGVALFRQELLPLATLLTPNAPEAAMLTGTKVSDEEGAMRAAETMLGWGAAAVLVKGGHLEGPESVDLLCAPADHGGTLVTRFSAPRIVQSNDRGTGCSLSSAIAAELALGRPLSVAVGNAKGWVARALSTATQIGRGRGGLDHWAPL